MGLFITFEGIEGCGKSTQARLLHQRLRRELGPQRVLLTKEPGGTAMGERVRDLLQHQSHPLTPLAELFLFEAARAQLVEQVLQPRLAQGHAVVCDRFADSSIAYQGYGRRLGAALVRQLNKQATRGLTPNLTVLLDIPVEAGFQRKGGQSLDRIEREERAFHERVRAGYLKLARAEPGRWLLLDGQQAIEALQEQIWRRVRPLLEKATR